MRVAALALGLAVASSLASVTRAAHAAPPGDVTFAISIAVALDKGAPARDDAWIAAQIEQANELYGPLGMRFRWTLRWWRRSRTSTSRAATARAWPGRAAPAARAT